MLFNVFITSRNVFIFNIKRSLALFSMSFCVQIRLLLPIILGISPPVLFVGSCLAYNTCMTKYAHTCKYLFDLLGYSITLIGAPFVLCKSEVSCTNSHCTVFLCLYATYLVTHFAFVLLFCQRRIQTFSLLCI